KFEAKRQEKERKRMQEYEAFKSHVFPKLDEFEKNVEDLNEQLALERQKVKEARTKTDKLDALEERMERLNKKLGLD
ncbi:MAG TPA: hypothetical protein VE593_02350, partial [Nitrososphaeraceae archaeon]|nr:hypothetical protein [Nitrososphaeraceae archaeon]